MVVRRRKGEVGCSSSRPSTLPLRVSYQSSGGRQTSTEVAESVASSAGRSHGTSAPASPAIAAMAGSSVETRMSQIPEIPLTTSMLQTISGLPPSKRVFFPGSRFDPPRAVISARILKALASHRASERVRQMSSFDKKGRGVRKRELLDAFGTVMVGEIFVNRLLGPRKALVIVEDDDTPSHHER